MNYCFVLPLFGILFAVRQVATYRLTRRAASRSDGQAISGRLILSLLWILYPALLVLAVHVSLSNGVGLVQWAGYTILISGTGLRLLALFFLGDMYAPAISLFAEHSLVRSGPYAALRHPLYLGLSIEVLGLAIVSAKPFGCGLAVAIIFLTQVQNRCEELALRRRLGAEYEQYALASWDLAQIPGMLKSSAWVADLLVSGNTRVISVTHFRDVDVSCVNRPGATSTCRGN